MWQNDGRGRGKKPAKGSRTPRRGQATAVVPRSLDIPSTPAKTSAGSRSQTKATRANAPTASGSGTRSSPAVVTVAGGSATQQKAEDDNPMSPTSEYQTASSHQADSSSDGDDDDESRDNSTAPQGPQKDSQATTEPARSSSKSKEAAQGSPSEMPLIVRIPSSPVEEGASRDSSPSPKGPEVPEAAQAAQAKGKQAATRSPSRIEDPAQGSLSPVYEGYNVEESYAPPLTFYKAALVGLGTVGYQVQNFEPGGERLQQNPYDPNQIPEEYQWVSLPTALQVKAVARMSCRDLLQIVNEHNLYMDFYKMHMSEIYARMFDREIARLHFRFEYKDKDFLPAFVMWFREKGIYVDLQATRNSVHLFMQEFFRCHGGYLQKDQKCRNLYMLAQKLAQLHVHKHQYIPHSSVALTISRTAEENQLRNAIKNIPHSFPDYGGISEDNWCELIRTNPTMLGEVLTTPAPPSNHYRLTTLCIPNLDTFSSGVKTGWAVERPTGPSEATIMSSLHLPPLYKQRFAYYVKRYREYARVMDEVRMRPQGVIFPRLLELLETIYVM